ncbi:MAG: hypothetical protein RQ729_04330 [Wenzhouxiangellaceae bacterium]|nr:hypothetical protein [Wenzhouxiangellaceae bacterium]
MFGKFTSALVALLLPLAAAAAENPSPLLYEIETAVWCSGDLRGQPRLQLAPGAADSFVINANDVRWRLQVEVEETSAAESPDADTVWLKVGIEQEIDGEWEFITDTMLGAPLGETGRITVVGESEAEETPDRAPLYVELMTKRVE